MKQDKQPTTVARLPRFPHDLSYDMSWTSSTGHILPVVSDFLNAGETINCSIDLRTRMQPLLRPAMLDVHQKIKYFFVPMDMIYSLFGAIRYQVDDHFSSAFDNRAIGRKNGFPIFSKNTAFNVNSAWAFEDGNGQVSNIRAGINSAANAPSGQTLAYFNKFDQYNQGAHRLLDMLGYNPDIVFGSSIPTAYSPYNPAVFDYKLFAYQAIYFNYFRDDELEANNHQAFNCDFQYAATLSSDIDQLADMMMLRYVGRFKDYFTNVHVNPLLNSMSLLNGSVSGDILSDANYWLYDSGATTPRPAVSDSLFDDQSLNSSRTSGYSPNDNDGSGFAQINASQLRLLFAVDKLLTVTGRAHKRVDDQVLAHFGFKVPTDVKHNIQYIGEQDGSFAVGDVISTSDTETAVLGELAGKAFGRVSGKGVSKFTAPCDGVFMGVYYSMPKVRYQSNFDRQNAVANREDFFIPEFDHLGMQPLYQYEMNRFSSAIIPPNTIYGWQWRYEQWKRKYNRVSAAFRYDYSDTNVLSAWTPIMNPMNTPKSAVTYDAVKVTPHDLDNIMVVPFADIVGNENPEEFAKNPYLLYATDPFVHDMHVNYKKVSVMSTFSIPSLDNNV